MGSILKNLHLIVFLLAFVKMGFIYYDSYEQTGIKQSEIDKATEELQKNKKDQKEIQKYLDNIKDEKLKIERVAEEIEKTQQLLPSEISDIENSSLLRKMAEDLNIKDISISPLNEENKEFYIAKKYKFKAKATYLQFLIVFEKISENKRILNVQDVSFKKMEQPQRSKFQLIDGEFSLEAYRYNPGHKEDRGFEEVEKEFKNKLKQSPKKSKQNESKEEV
jgi:Tfp pilus assembly protein PilO